MDILLKTREKYLPHVFYPNRWQLCENDDRHIMTDNKKLRRDVVIFTSIGGLIGGVMGFRGFYTHDPADLLYFSFFVFLFFLKDIHKGLGYLGLLGVIGILVALMAMGGLIRI